MYPIFSSAGRLARDPLPSQAARQAGAGDVIFKRGSWCGSVGERDRVLSPLNFGAAAFQGFRKEVRRYSMCKGPQVLLSKAGLQTCCRLILGLALHAFCCLPGFERYLPWS